MDLQVHYQSDYMQNLIAEKYYDWLLLVIRDLCRLWNFLSYSYWYLENMYIFHSFKCKKSNVYYG